MSDADAEVLLLRPFAAYKCQRTMVCCHEPFAANVSTDDEARLRTALMANDAGREIIKTLDDTLGASIGDQTRREWKKPLGRCMHLVVDGDDATRGCHLHHVVGLGGLPTACRNFPRFVQEVGDHLEVTFELSCPTAAKLLTEDPAPMTVVALPRSSWPYGPRATTTVPTERRALRDAWWAVFAEARGSAADVVAAVGALLTTPLTPPTERWPALPSALERPVSPMAAMAMVQGIVALPERGDTYAAVVLTLMNELLSPWTTARLVAAAEPSPSIVAAFAEHQIHNLVAHTSAPPEQILVLAAMRAVAALRVVDALCDLVPFRSRVLFADAFSVCTRVDPALSPARPAPLPAPGAPGPVGSTDEPSPGN